MRRERLVITQRTDTFAIPCEHRPTFVVVDPDMRVLGDVRVKAPNDMLREQLLRAPTGRGRWLAASALSTSDDPTTVAALAARLEDDAEAWAVRGEVRRKLLGRIWESECGSLPDALVRSAAVAHPKVRRLVVSALEPLPHAGSRGRHPSARLCPTRSYLVEAEAARALGKTKRESTYEVC